MDTSTPTARLRDELSHFMDFTFKSPLDQENLTALSSKFDSLGVISRGALGERQSQIHTPTAKPCEANVVDTDHTENMCTPQQHFHEQASSPSVQSASSPLDGHTPPGTPAEAWVARARIDLTPVSSPHVGRSQKQVSAAGKSPAPAKKMASVPLYKACVQAAAHAAAAAAAAAPQATIAAGFVPQEDTSKPYDGLAFVASTQEQLLSKPTGVAMLTASAVVVAQEKAALRKGATLPNKSFVAKKMLFENKAFASRAPASAATLSTTEDSRVASSTAVANAMDNSMPPSFASKSAVPSIQDRVLHFQQAAKKADPLAVGPVMTLKGKSVDLRMFSLKHRPVPSKKPSIKETAVVLAAANGASVSAPLSITESTIDSEWEDASDNESELAVLRTNRHLRSTVISPIASSLSKVDMERDHEQRSTQSEDILNTIRRGISNNVSHGDRTLAANDSGITLALYQRIMDEKEELKKVSTAQSIAMLELELKLQDIEVQNRKIRQQCEQKLRQQEQKALAIEYELQEQLEASHLQIGELTFERQSLGNRSKVVDEAPMEGSREGPDAACKRCDGANVTVALMEKAWNEDLATFKREAAASDKKIRSLERRLDSVLEKNEKLSQANQEFAFMLEEVDQESKKLRAAKKIAEDENCALRAAANTPEAAALKLALIDKEYQITILHQELSRRTSQMNAAATTPQTAFKIDDELQGLRALIADESAAAPVYNMAAITAPTPGHVLLSEAGMLNSPMQHARQQQQQRRDRSYSQAVVYDNFRHAGSRSATPLVVARGGRRPAGAAASSPPNRVPVTPGERSPRGSPLSAVAEVVTPPPPSRFMNSISGASVLKRTKKTKKRNIFRRLADRLRRKFGHAKVPPQPAHATKMAAGVVAGAVVVKAAVVDSAYSARAALDRAIQIAQPPPFPPPLHNERPSARGAKFSGVEV